MSTVAAYNTGSVEVVNRTAVSNSMSDDELLKAYRESKSPEAFAAMVERHTPMVYAACLRMLRDPHAAEDATQATFLVLMRKAGDLKPNSLLAGWLYTTAQSCARDLQRAQSRRAKYEQQAKDMNNSMTA